MNRDNVYVIKKPYESDCFSFYHETGFIGLKMRFTHLTDDELLEYISDSIIHEHIHKTLDKLFNIIVSRLFDGIEHLFRNHAIHEKQVRTRNLNSEYINRYETYHSYIKSQGFNKFLEYYYITQEDICHANKICSDRLYKIDLNQAKNVTWRKLKESQENK